MGILDTPPDERVDRVTRLAQQMFNVPMVSVSLIDRDRQWRKSEVGIGSSESPRQDSFCDYTVRQNASVVVEDATSSEVFGLNPYVVGEPHVRFYAAEPLHAPGGEPVGTLCIIDVRPRAFSDAEMSVLRDLAFWVESELARDQEMNHAALVQQALRPGTLPQVPGYTVAADTRPVGTLSGDMYDMVLRDGRLRVSLADAMGKGIGPAIASSFVRASLGTAPGRDIVEAVTEADRLLDSAQWDTTLFVTAVHAELHIDSGMLEIVDAGHGLAFILRADGEFEQLRSTGLPLGMGAGLGEQRVSTRTRLLEGDMFLCCSDGLLDVLDPDDPFAQVAETLRALGPNGAVREAMALATSTPATDDLTVLAIRRDQ
ncbi:SpoIIE family protein phosphatase [Tessaracoccus sp. MC1865]|uniref:PP2C family protein-serine/threonine phosphatase n=1 Tax=Tessaracoccus sp. MC1865 TaxID=2760310 RepID=UPI001603991C|nr:GAF domain-containing SpoIIE family protein phosphatase [Tessaracoccus sp. MC1865]MBB1484472.1 SpoIIE family protein phosphatase [Tessaracoccus sp. MC1865]QTO38425.1 SpoIIE family protein phosphatase [Tessaracoccus sp. MC1865]